MYDWVFHCERLEISPFEPENDAWFVCDFCFPFFTRDFVSDSTPAINLL